MDSRTTAETHTPACLHAGLHDICGRPGVPTPPAAGFDSPTYPSDFFAAGFGRLPGAGEVCKPHIRASWGRRGLGSAHRWPVGRPGQLRFCRSRVSLQAALTLDFLSWGSRVSAPVLPLRASCAAAARLWRPARRTAHTTRGAAAAPKAGSPSTACLEVHVCAYPRHPLRARRSRVSAAMHEV